MTASGWLGMLGLGRRAGVVVIGTAGVRAGLQRGELALVVMAGDRSSRTEEKVGRLARALAVPVVEGPVAAALGRQLGRPAVQAVGVRDAQLAEGIRARVAGNGSGGVRG